MPYRTSTPRLSTAAFAARQTPAGAGSTVTLCETLEAPGSSGNSGGFGQRTQRMPASAARCSSQASTPTTPSAQACSTSSGIGDGSLRAC